MKKMVSLVAAVAMLMSLCACGASQDNAAAAAEPVSSEENTVESETENAADSPNTVTDTDAESVSDLSTNQQIAVWLVQQFCASDFFREITENYESASGTSAREVEVTHGDIYELEDFNGIPVHAVMLCLSADWCYEDTVDESIYLLVDLETGDIYNSVTADMDSGYGLLLSCMHSHVESGQSPLWTDMESCTELTAEEIAALNAALAGR